MDDDLNTIHTIKVMVVVTAVLLIVEVVLLTIFGGAAYPVGMFNNASSWSMIVPPLPW